VNLQPGLQFFHSALNPGCSSNPGVLLSIVLGYRCSFQDSVVVSSIFLWSPYVIGQTIYIFILTFVLSFFFFPRLISVVGDWMSCVSYFHTWCGLSANLECRSEMCCTVHAARCKCGTQKNRHLGTIAQICQAISSQLRHVSPFGKTC